MKSKSKKKKTKYISPSMKYNPGTAKYEPELPLKETGKKFKLKISWILILILLVAILCFGYAIISSILNYK